MSFRLASTRRLLLSTSRSLSQAKSASDSLRTWRPQSSPAYTPVRLFNMASPRKYEWLIVVPDVPGMLAKRMEVRSKHFEGLKRFDGVDNLKLGGALLDEVPPDDEPSSLKINGSTLIFVASTREEIMDMLKSDIYAKEGVWDLDKVQMWPLKCAIRKP